MASTKTTKASAGAASPGLQLSAEEEAALLNDQSAGSLATPELRTPAAASHVPIPQDYEDVSLVVVFIISHHNSTLVVSLLRIG